MPKTIRPLSGAPRRIEWGGRFKRDYRREIKGRHGPALIDDFGAVVDALVNRRPLETRHHDHALKGEWSDCRDCHVRPDLVLIYRLADDDTLQLVRLGSHAELGL